MQLLYIAFAERIRFTRQQKHQTWGTRTDEN